MAKSLLPRTRTVCPYSNSSRRDFTAETQRETRGDEEEREEQTGNLTQGQKSSSIVITSHESRSSKARLNTKARRHKGQRGREEIFSRKERKE